MENSLWSPHRPTQASRHRPEANAREMAKGKKGEGTEAGEVARERESESGAIEGERRERERHMSKRS